MRMNSRLQLRQTLSFSKELPPPRYESEFSEDVIHVWKAQGRLGHLSPEEHFRLDRREALPVEWRRKRDEKLVLESESALESFRGAYDAACAERLPEDWGERLSRLRRRDFALSITPWNEGFLQVIGISDWNSFHRAILLLYDQPSLIEAAMAHYAGYLEAMLDCVLAESRLEVDYAVFYVPIASNHSPVVSPRTYARLALPAIRRVVKQLDRYGIAFRFVWTTGQVRPLIPLWLDAGINGLVITQAGAIGLSYVGLRREFGSQLRFFGGIDWRALMQGPSAIDEVLDRTARPLLEEGGYIPHLDDTVRGCIPFDSFSYYRQRLDALVAEIHALG